MELTNKFATSVTKTYKNNSSHSRHNLILQAESLCDIFVLNVQIGAELLSAKKYVDLGKFHFICNAEEFAELTR